MKVAEESTRPVVGATTSAIPPVLAEEQMKRRDADDTRAGGTKRFADGDYMDVEQTSVREETMASGPAKEHPTDKPAPTEIKDTVEDARMH